MKKEDANIERVKISVRALQKALAAQDARINETMKAIERFDSVVNQYQKRNSKGETQTR